MTEFGLFDRGNLIVFAPTSSGKTFIGEMAAVKAAREKTKVFYLVPQKALAEEKYQEFSKRYAGSGIKVVVSSHDRREFDREIVRKSFNIAIVVFEKLQLLLVDFPQSWTRSASPLWMSHRLLPTRRADRRWSYCSPSCGSPSRRHGSWAPVRRLREAVARSQAGHR